MKESEIRKCLAEALEQLTDEKRARERAEQTAADLAKALAERCPPMPSVPPIPPPMPYIPGGVYAYMTPFPDPSPGLLPDIFVAYAVAFPDDPSVPVSATFTYSAPPETQRNTVRVGSQGRVLP